MPKNDFTPAQDHALMLAIMALPVQRIAAALLFLALRNISTRVAIVQLLAGL
jgi:hypothetical protein